MKNKRLIAVGHRSGNRWVMRVRESERLLPVTRKGIERGLARVFEEVKRSASK